MWSRVVIVLSLSALSHHAFAYKAAVLEYFPQKEANPHETILKNIDQYRGYADQAKNQSVNILVFPEYGLTTVVENPEDYAINVTESDQIIKELSTIARERQLYMVVNVIEKEQSGDETKYYNTNLVFDKNGTIILKYRKINLYKETKLTAGSTDQKLTFSTDFGTTFGIFTCFDILARQPSRKILESMEVVDIVFPTAWISKMPLYVSLSVQHGYAFANGVNLLASNYATPKKGRGGSGIYFADGKIGETYIADSASSKLIVQDVSIKSRQSVNTCLKITPQGLPTDTDTAKSNVTDYITENAFDTSRHQFKIIDLSQEKSKTTVCDRDFCCTFEINVSSTNSSEIYKVMAFDGTVNYREANPQVTEAHLRVCSLVACEDNRKESCGARINGTTKFTKIKVSGNLPMDETAFYTPVTINSYLLPMKNLHFCDTKNGTNTTYIELTTFRSQENVLAFGLVGRTEIPVETNNPDDNRNSDESGGSGGSKLYATFVFLVFSITMKHILS